MKKSQKQRVIGRLLQTGQITRNECIRNYITRLSAIIQDLEEEGWVFDPKKVGNDFVYYLKSSPYETIVYKLPDGQLLETYGTR